MVLGDQQTEELMGRCIGIYTVCATFHAYGMFRGPLGPTLLPLRGLCTTCSTLPTTSLLLRTGDRSLPRSPYESPRNVHKA